jgi:hypothetical protein
MLELTLGESTQPKRGPTNRDYRILSLLLTCATRADLFEDYVTGKDHHLQELGLPQNLLDESRYLFRLPETQRALRQLQLVTQTLVELNDYCSSSCPSDFILSQISWVNAHQSMPLPAAGTEPR